MSYSRSLWQRLSVSSTNSSVSTNSAQYTQAPPRSILNTYTSPGGLSAASLDSDAPPPSRTKRISFSEEDAVRFRYPPSKPPVHTRAKHGASRMLKSFVDTIRVDTAHLYLPPPPPRRHIQRVHSRATGRTLTPPIVSSRRSHRRRV